MSAPDRATLQRWLPAGLSILSLGLLVVLQQTGWFRRFAQLTGRRLPPLERLLRAPEVLLGPPLLLLFLAVALLAGSRRFPPVTPDEAPERRHLPASWRIALAVILLVSLGAKLYRFGQTPYGLDNHERFVVEAALNGQAAWEAGSLRALLPPGMGPMGTDRSLSLLAQVLLEGGVIGMRLARMGLTFLSLFLLYRLGSRLAGPRPAALAVGLMACGLPELAVSGGRVEVPLATPVVIACLYCLHGALTAPRGGRAIACALGAGALISLGLFTYASCKFLIPAALLLVPVSLLFQHRAGKELRSARVRHTALLLAALLLGFVLSLHLLLNARDPRFPEPAGQAAALSRTLSAITGRQAGTGVLWKWSGHYFWESPRPLGNLARNLIRPLALLTVSSPWNDTVTLKRPHGPLVHSVTAWLFWLGLAAVLLAWRRREERLQARAFLLIWLATAFLPALVSDDVVYRRFQGALPAIYLLAGIGLTWLVRALTVLRAVPGFGWRRGLQTASLVLVLAVGLGNAREHHLRLVPSDGSMGAEQYLLRAFRGLPPLFDTRAVLFVSPGTAQGNLEQGLLAVAPERSLYPPTVTGWSRAAWLDLLDGTAHPVSPPALRPGQRVHDVRRQPPSLELKLPLVPVGRRPAAFLIVQAAPREDPFPAEPLIQDLRRTYPGGVELVRTGSTSPAARLEVQERYRVVLRLHSADEVRRAWDTRPVHSTISTRAHSPTLRQEAKAASS